jgi:hypothetical protein
MRQFQALQRYFKGGFMMTDYGKNAWAGYAIAGIS